MCLFPIFFQQIWTGGTVWCYPALLIRDSLTLINMQRKNEWLLFYWNIEFKWVNETLLYSIISNYFAAFWIYFWKIKRFFHEPRYTAVLPLLVLDQKRSRNLKHHQLLGMSVQVAVATWCLQMSKNHQLNLTFYSYYHLSIFKDFILSFILEDTMEAWMILVMRGRLTKLFSRF